jgi:hypothetical protein
MSTFQFLIKQGEVCTYQARESPFDSDLLTLLNWNIAADCIVARVNVFTILSERIHLTFYVNVSEGYAIRSFLKDFHGEKPTILGYAWLQRA